VAVGQVQDQGAVETTGMVEVYVFDAGAGQELGGDKVALKAPVLSVLNFAIDEWAEPVLEGGIRIRTLRAVRAGR
jgi:hypothetical protein